MKVFPAGRNFFKAGSHQSAQLQAATPEMSMRDTARTACESARVGLQCTAESPFKDQPGDVPDYSVPALAIWHHTVYRLVRCKVPRCGPGWKPHKTSGSWLPVLQTIDNPHFWLLQQMIASIASDKWRPSLEQSKAFMQGPSLSTTRGSPRSQGLGKLQSDLDPFSRGT